MNEDCCLSQNLGLGETKTLDNNISRKQRHTQEITVFLNSKALAQSDNLSINKVLFEVSNTKT